MATCTACNTELTAGLRWCGMCHAHTVDASIGRLASPGKRLGAYVLDLMIPFLAFFLMFVVAGAGIGTGSEAGAGFGSLLAFALFVAYVIWALMLFAHGTTPGKKALGMRVVREDGRHAGFPVMLVREWVGKWISGILFFLGFFWILFDRDRQGWHDKLMSTYVVDGFAPAPASLTTPAVAG